MSSLKKYHRLPVYIAEDHNEVLSPILRSIATKHLPFKQNLLIHLDSHPDLLIPARLQKYEVYTKEILLDRISIENWIMPAVFAGHFDTLVWVKPPWSNQISDGVYSFSIGIEKSTGFVKVSCDLFYFVSEMLYCKEPDLTDNKQVTLHVITLGDRNMLSEAVSMNSPPEKAETCNPTDKSPPDAAEPRPRRSSSEEYEDSIITLQMLIDRHDGVYVLDVDLDFFTTLNPFINQHKNVDMYDRLKDIYKFDLNQAGNQPTEDTQTRRKEQIDPLEQLFKSLDDLKDADVIKTRLPELLQKVPNRHDRQLVESLIVDLLDKAESDVDWLIVHDAGCTWDCTDRVLPHHPSTDEEIRSLMATSCSFLDFFKPPVFVTVARSSLDDYCPPDKVDFVQDLFCTFLTRKFEKIDIVKLYQCEE